MSNICAVVVCCWLYSAGCSTSLFAQCGVERWSVKPGLIPMLALST